MPTKTTASDVTRKNAKAIAASINRKHGPGTVVIASQARLKPPRLSTGSLALDVSMRGGWPVNQWSEIIGLESAGKTTVALKSIAAAMAADPDFEVVWVAAEVYDEDYAQLLGVDNRRVYLVSDNIMEYAYDAVLEYVENRACDMVVIDSLPALVPLDEDDKSMEEWSLGTGARRTNQFMRKATKATKRSLTDHDRPIVGVIINQWRNKIGVLHGDPRTTPGGLAKNFWMYARMEARREEWIYDPDTKQKVGQTIKVSTFKMKGARPGPPASVDFYFADCNGIDAGSYDIYKEMLNLAMAFEIIERRGNAYAYESVRYPGGKQGFYDAIRADDALYDRVRKEVLEAASGVTSGEDDDIPEPDETPAPVSMSKIRRRA